MFQAKELRQPRPYVELIATVSRGKVNQTQTLPDDPMLIAKVAKDWSIDDGHLIRVADSTGMLTCCSIDSAYQPSSVCSAADTSHCSDHL